MGFAYPIDSKVVTNPNGTIDYDRASSSTQLRGLIKSMITNGVNLTESTNLQVMADEETMNLVVKPGYVIIEGALKHFEDDVKVTLANADTTNPRIDTVVARLNLNEDVRDIVIDVLQGTPAAEPIAPELTRTTSYYEVGLADVLVELGTTQISQAVVTDTRLLNSRCGMISAIGEIDTETLFNQLTTDFDNWFESIKGKLGDDVAGGLQMQIDGLADDIDTLQEDVEILKGNDSTMIWDISEELYSESRDVSTMPRNITNGYVVKLNDIFYMIGGTEDGHMPSYKYVEGEWIEDTVLGGIAIMKRFDNRYGASSYKLGGVSNTSSEIYYTTYGSGNGLSQESYGRGTVNIYDGTTKTSQKISFANDSSNDNRYGSIGVACGNQSCRYLSLTYANADKMATLRLGSTTTNKGTSLGNDLSKGNWRVLSQGVYHKGYYVFLVTQMISHGDSSPYSQTLKTYLLFTTAGGNLGRTIDVPDSYTLITDMVAINDYIYITNVYGQVLRWSFNTQKWENVNIGNGSLVLHDGEIHRFNETSHTACKLYREAKTYAPKNTKIYLPYDSKALSDNLEAIDGGYIVTESGNITIAMYDY